MPIQALCPLLLGCLFPKTIFYSSFKFREKLRVWYRDFPYALCPPRRPPPFHQRPPPEGTFIVTDEPTRTSAVWFRPLLVLCVLWFGPVSRAAVPRVGAASLPQPRDRPRFTASTVLPLLQRHTVRVTPCRLFSPTFLLNMHVGFIYIFSWFHSSFFFSAE